ncbi:branched-chain amino acid aminotransferase/4-amino-4-deoxychorismate lyase [Pontibacter aydingkolensis]|uniref:branched-chain-amino-acid transaminase n=1 Tax=Pontibacter aydingkolensis TaxID=1911536 RepID=A0ABS7CZY5_9BACT|nr:aminotransferase class IV [Pontibacter aydingkolensis]MBW7469092.1 aminotransferase class IV [Pontibacter aydingkolensis]
MLLYNGQFILEKDLKLPISNRAFQYNDSFFETVMVVDGKLRFWQDHVDRMQEAAASLKLELPLYFTEGTIEQQLLQLAEQNQAVKYGRLKLKVWRAGAGLYTPEVNSVDWLATVAPAAPTASESISIGICQIINTIYSPLSHFKGPNALIYTLAGIEKKNSSYDDLLLLNPQGVVSELISSNLFWLIQDKLYTPALDTGCVNGIARRNIIRWCRQAGVPVKEVYFSPERLFEADVLFAANVIGIRKINLLKGVILKSESSDIFNKIMDKHFIQA